MRIKSALVVLLTMALTSFLLSCLPGTNPQDGGTPQDDDEIPLDTHSLVIKVEFGNSGNYPDFIDTLVPVADLDVAITTMDYTGARVNWGTLRTKKTNQNGVVVFTYSELDSAGIRGSASLSIIAADSVLYGTYNGSEYLSGTSFLFDDRNTYDTLPVRVYAYGWGYLAGFEQFNLVAASVGTLESDIASTCNNDDYLWFEDLYPQARLHYSDSTDSCSGFPTSPAILTLASTNQRVFGRYDTAAQAFELTNTINIYDGNAGTPNSLWGNSVSLSLDLEDTLTLASSDPTSGLSVIKKFKGIR